MEKYNMSKLLLKNINALMTDAKSQDKKGYDLLIVGNRIEKIAKNIVPEFGTRVIDCSRHVVIPGLVNTHHHFYQTLTRNIPDVAQAKLYDWLVFLYEIWKNVDDEAVYFSSLTAMGELLKSGCTCSTDHHSLYSDAMKGDVMATQFAAADALGMRFAPTRGSMSLSKKDGGLPPDSVVQDEDVILADCERVIKKFHDPSEGSMHRIILAPCSPFSVTLNSLKDAAEMAKKYSVRLHTHLCETMDEENQMIAMYGKRPLELMEDCGFIGENVFYAHGIWFNDAELKVLKKTKTGISHCPSSNMRLGSGICRVREMLDMGINVSCGVDGSASNDSSNMLAELRNALLLQRVKYKESGLTAREAFRIGTINGAKTLGFEKVGELREGWLADVAVYPISDIGYVGAKESPVDSLLFTQTRNADYTIVNGKVVVDHGNLVGMDENYIVSNADRLAKALYEKRR